MPGKGRKRTVNKLTESHSSRMVCLSKRRKGLLKKADELSILIGAKVSVLTISQAGKLYCSDTQAFDSLLCPQVHMISDKEIVQTLAAVSILCPQLEMSSETGIATDAEDMIEELFSSDVPTLNSLFFPKPKISSENDAWESLFPAFDICREKRQKIVGILIILKTWMERECLSGLADITCRPWAVMNSSNWRESFWSTGR